MCTPRSCGAPWTLGLVEIPVSRNDGALPKEAVDTIDPDLVAGIDHPRRQIVLLAERFRLEARQAN